MASSKYRHVVILGGGFSGPLMALALSRHAQKITLIERYSREPDEEWLGTPQHHHGHYLTQKGQGLLENLCPGVLKQLRSRGAREIDWAKNASWTGHGGVTPLYDSGVRSLLFSRRLLDQILMSRAAAIGHLTVVKETVEALEFNDQRVQTIRLSHDRSISDMDLVIDARGRTARMRETLQELLGPIPERVIQNNITYHTVSLDHHYDPNVEVQQFYRQPDLSNDGIGYFASPIEGNRVKFTVSDYFGHRNSRPFDALRNHPLLQGKDLSHARIFTNLSSVHTQYGKSRRWIDNYLLVGDAVCRLNPVFAHGMTVALEMVTAFREELLGKERISTHQMQRRFDSFVRAPWLFVQIDSIRTRQNQASLGIRILRASIRGMFYATAHDPEVHRTALRVVHRIVSPAALLSPVFLVRILACLALRGWANPQFSTSKTNLRPRRL